ncbi:MAG: hypothetical protein LBE48_00945 [Methanomassiliicoccaceae archaeon]|jgi:hypothetical protein|nr:hypothetical protein [Methanomassiliicoccaceae archaeon]
MDKRQEAMMNAKSNIDAKLTNYRILFTLDVQGQGIYYFRQISSDKGTFFELKDKTCEITYVDFVNNIGYELDGDEKCGESFPLEPVEAFKGLAFHTAGHLLFLYEGAKDSMVKVGKEKVLGRDTTSYVHTFSNGEMKFWIDDEYGLALKYEQTGEYRTTMCVTEFTVGGVTVEDIIDLDEYEIT